MRERQRKKKGRTWAEAAKTVLEKYPNTPMSHKEILQVIQREKLKEIRSGTSPLACLNAMLHTNSRGEEGIFYKIPGRMGVYTLKKDIADVAKELSEDGSDESSDNLSDSQSTENSSSAITTEDRRGRWMRRVPAKLQSQPSSPQPRCSSPSVPTSKLISPSQKHSKKALKQALKQQQQRNQRRQGGMPTSSSPRLLLKTIKDMADNITTKTDLCHPVVPRKVTQRSGRLSAGHLRRAKCTIDVETPDSILVNTNLRAIINKHTFSVLPPDCQQRLLKLLPEVDQQACMDGLLKVTSSALNNEFFTSAAQSWKERLAEGEFTPELQLRMRQEIEKEKKVELWKEAFFENYYGENSGLSFEDSKELTKADRHQEFARSHQTRTTAQAPGESKGTKDGRQTDSGASVTAVKDVKPTQELQKTQPAQKESVSTTEPMKTRRSHYAEERRLNTAAQPEPVVATQEAERQTEREAVVTVPEKVLKKEVKEERAELPQSPEIKSSPPKASSELKEDQPASVVKPAEESGKIISEPSGPSEPQKRKSLSEMEGEVTPEKRPRMSSVSSLSSVSSVSPLASSISSPATPTSTTNQRVPPLKIPVSRILPIPVSPSQVSPRTPLSSPGRTGARTLADIKAKAQLARAQRAAAAAVSKGAVPGPGPGGGRGEQPSPSPSPTSPQAPTRLSASDSSSNSQTTPLDSFGQISPSLSQTCFSSRTDDKNKGQSPGSVSAGNQNTSHSTLPTPPSVHTLKGHENPSPAGLLSRTSSCIPANNPLVTQLLQGKEVPLEQILPKPLSKVDVKMSNVPLGSKGKTSHSAEHRTDKPMSHHSDTAGRVGVLSDYPRHHRELPDKDTQEQILQALMQRKVQQGQAYGVMGSQQHQYKPHQLVHAEETPDQSRISIGFLSRKRTPRPAMTGHYLLNVSTYGRGSESRRLQQSAIPNTSVSSLKRESTEGEEAAKDVDLARKVFSPVSGVKTEQQGFSISKFDEAVSFQHCSNVKTEPGLEDSETGAENNSTNATAKDTSSYFLPHRRHLELCNSNQGNSEPYINPLDPNHQLQSAFQTQRTHDNQEPVAASCYGGTISMSVPHTLNHSTAGTDSSVASTEADSGVMSFSVTVTTIPAGRSLDHGNQGEPSPEQSFMEGSNMDDVQSKCYCRLKAMIMCKGCGAFCHDDCIGPSKLCVSCLVVRI
nr:putative Polycomb group protein ASXL2 isoform X1 [Labrus bergylta]